jgi:hypothetical protein
MESLGSGAAVLDLLFQIGSYRSILFDFGTDVSTWTFEFSIKKNKGDRLKILSLTLGSGLSFPVYASDQIQAVFSSANTSIQEGQYYYELRRTDIALPLVNGFAYFSFDAPQGSVDETTLGLTVEQQTISLVITNLYSISSAEIVAALGYTPANAASFSNVNNTSDANKPVSIAQQAALDLKQNLVNAAVALVDAASMALTAIKHTLTSSAATRTFTISYTGDDITLEVTLNTTTATYTFPSGSLCSSEGTASGDNTLSLSGVSGDKYIIAIKKIGSAYYVACKNFGQ